MKYLSVCSGIEAATQAWHPLGWQPVAFSEIEPFPSAVLAHHYPSVPNWGDMTRFQEWPDANVDVLVGGTPCQSFSVAGLRKGLADPRGNLMLTYLAIADRYRPRWIVWENVPGVLSSNKGRDFGSFLGGLGQLGYGFAYRVLDAQYVRTQRHAWAVPQRRRRVFVVGYLGDWRRAAAVLIEPESLRGDSPPSRKAGQSAPTSTPARLDGSCSVSGCDRPARKRGWCNTHYQRWRANGFVADTPVNDPGQSDRDRFWPKVAKSGGCWDWSAAINEKGYGIFWSNDEARTVRAHRFAYEDAKGEIPDGLELDHLCRNRRCVNPDHLEPVTGRENTRRGNAGKWSRAGSVAPTISARTQGGGGLGTDFDLDGGLIAADVAPTINAHFGDKMGLENQHINGGGACSLPPVSLCLNAGGMGRIDAESETLIPTIGGAFDVAHTLKADGFDASEDGTGRGTPLVPVAIQERAICENPDAGPDGAGFRQDGASYTIEARQVPQAVAHPIVLMERGRNGGQSLETRQDGVANAILTPNGGVMPAVAQGWIVRRLTPTECERLQGFPDGFTKIPGASKGGWRQVDETEDMDELRTYGMPLKLKGNVWFVKDPDGPRYKALGNSMAVNCMTWIGERIAKVDAL